MGRLSISPLAKALGAAALGGLRCVAAALLAPECPCCRVEMGWGIHGVCRFCWEDLSLPPGPTCRDCGRVLPEETRALRCGRCTLVRSSGREPEWHAAVALGDYDGRLRELIHAFKFDDRPALARPLGSRLAERLVLEGLGPWGAGALLVPVPLGRERRAARGYDQSLLLARHLGRGLRRLGFGPAPVIRALRRVREGPPQAGLGRTGRALNLEGAFGPGAGVREIAGRRVVLVDDVLTTGATASACIRAMRKAGAGPFMVAVAGRTPQRMARMDRSAAARRSAGTRTGD